MFAQVSSHREFHSWRAKARSPLILGSRVSESQIKAGARPLKALKTNTKVFKSILKLTGNQ